VRSVRFAEEAAKTRTKLATLLNHPGHDQKSHGRKGSGKTGQDALDAVPAKLTPGPRGHFGDYEGESLAGPDGMGSVRALSEYEGVEYDRTNGVLRNRERWEENPTDISREMVAEVDVRVADIDQTMQASRLQDDVVVERTIQYGQAVFGDAYHLPEMLSQDFDAQDAGYERWQNGERTDLTGLRFRDRAYVSTTADSGVATQYGQRFARANSGTDGEPVIMRIHAPKGTGAVQLSQMGREAEVLLERGLSFEVTADHGVDDAGFRRIDVSVVE
jgi:hypothetical protein